MQRTASGILRRPSGIRVTLTVSYSLFRLVATHGVLLVVRWPGGSRSRLSWSAYVGRPRGTIQYGASIVTHTHCRTLAFAVSCLLSQSAVGMPPLTSGEARETFTLRPGYRIELMAAEPVVRDPVSFDWGPDGTLWVVEMSDYPLGLDGQGSPGGRIVRLFDDDGNGRYDRSVVFLNKLSFPTGVRPWRGGALVTTVPRILFAKDLDGDGRADVTNTLYEGFHHGNEQHLVNNLAWGLDNWFHCANGDSGGEIRSVLTNVKVSIRGRDFRIRPGLGLLEVESGQTQFSRTRDDWGNWFGCSNPTPIFHFVLEDRYLRRNPHCVPPRSRKVLYPGESPVYPTSETLPRFNMPWQANRFTSCNGIVAYRDTVLGAEFRGDAFVSEPVHNLVHHIDLRPDGVSFHGSREVGQEEKEFVSSTDNWFRPTKLRVGPDGALWIADMYREVLEHPEYFFMGPFAEFNVRAGEDRGRIYRVVPVDGELRPATKLTGTTSLALTEKLGSANGWVRDMAHQLLVERCDRSVAGRLREVAVGSSESLARLHALCALDGIGELDAATVTRSLADAHAGVRRHAVRLAQGFVGDDPAVGGALLRLLDDTSATVQLQLAYTLGEWGSQRAGEALGRLALAHADDEYLLAACESSAMPHLEEIGAALLEATDTPPGSLLERFLPMAVAATVSRPAVQRAFLLRITEPDGAGFSPWQFRALVALVDRGTETAPLLFESAGALHDRLQGVAEAARGTAADANAAVETRQAAIGLLGRRSALSGEQEVETARELLLSLLAARHPPLVSEQAAASLGHLVDESSHRVLLRDWRSRSPALKKKLLLHFQRRGSWWGLLLDAVEDGTILRDEIDANFRGRMLGGRDDNMRERAARVFRVELDADRETVIERFRGLKPAPDARARGLEIFEKKCATCHRFGDKGHDVGASLAAITDKSVDSLLASILDPNRSVEEKFYQYVVVTRDGLTFNGIFGGESGNSVELVMPDGKPVQILRRDLVSIQDTRTSLMPVGLEEGLTRDDMAALIALLQSTP